MLRGKHNIHDPSCWGTRSAGLHGIRSFPKLESRLKRPGKIQMGGSKIIEGEGRAVEDYSQEDVCLVIRKKHHMTYM